MKFMYTLVFILSFSAFASFPVLQTGLEVIPKNTDENPISVKKIALNESFEFEEYSLKFEAVIEDSRCPKGTDCIWEGLVKVRIGVSSKNAALEYKEVTLKSTSESQIIVTTSSGTKLILKGVSPYPDARIPTSERKYELIIEMVEKANEND